MPPIINLFFKIKQLLMVLICSDIQYPINITSILGIWSKTNFLVPPIDVTLMENLRFTREVEEPQHIRVFANKNLVLAYYMLSAW